MNESVLPEAQSRLTFTSTTAALAHNIKAVPHTIIAVNKEQW